MADVYLIALIVDAVTREAEGRLIAVILALALCKLAAGLVMRFADWQLSARNYRSKMKFLSERRSLFCLSSSFLSGAVPRDFE